MTRFRSVTWFNHRSRLTPVIFAFGAPLTLSLDLDEHRSIIEPPWWNLGLVEWCRTQRPLQRQGLSFLADAAEPRAIKLMQADASCNVLAAKDSIGSNSVNKILNPQRFFLGGAAEKLG